MGPVVRQGDDAWFNVVKWTYYALLNAEELGITQANVDEMKKIHQSGNQARPRRTNADGSAAGFGTGIGLDETGPFRSSRMSAITAKSSSAMSARSTPLKIARGKNALWSKGGLQYAPPIR